MIRLGMIRAGRLPLAVAAVLCLAACAAPGAEETQPIQVRIENATGEALRCVAVLAHFVTRTLPAIPSGRAHEMTLERDPKTGTLSYGSHGAHPMMLENLLCGTVPDWTASSRDLPVLSMRSGEAVRFDYRCTLSGETVACVPR
jgi:hypothetical protein